MMRSPVAGILQRRKVRLRDGCQAMDGRHRGPTLRSPMAAATRAALAACLLQASGCTLVPTDAYVNRAAPGDEAAGPGTLIATMAVPWHLDFQCAGGATPCPTPEQAAACRRFLFYGGEGDPCAEIPRDADFVA